MLALDTVLTLNIHDQICVELYKGRLMLLHVIACYCGQMALYINNINWIVDTDVDVKPTHFPVS